MKQSIEIRSARPEDLAAVGRLYTHSWRRTYRGLIPDRVLDAMTEEGSREKWMHYLVRPENEMFVLVHAGKVEGFAACRPLPERENSALLDSLHVDPACQGRGAGRRLIAQTARWARERGFGALVVFVVQGNHRAEALYRRMGARELYFFHDPEDGAPSWALAWENLEELERSFSQ